MMAWDSDNPTPVTPIRDLILACCMAMLILAVGFTMGEIVGKEKGFAHCAERVSTLSAQMDALDADLTQLDRFRGFTVSYVSHQPTAGKQTILLVGPDSINVEVEK